MNLKTSNYGAARSILGISEILLWCGVGLGVIVALGAGGAASRGFGASGMVAAAPGIAISLFCFIGIVQVQMSKAAVDTADYTYQMLGIARDQLAVSKRAMNPRTEARTYSASKAETGLSATQKPPVAQDQSRGAEGSRARGAVSTEIDDNLPSFLQSEQALSQSPQSTQHRGRQINRTIHGFLVEGHTFANLELAKNHIDAEHLKAEMASSKGRDK